MPGIVRRPGEARVIDLGGFTVTVLADAADTADAFSLIETGERGVDLGPPLHIHRDAVESFYVIDGAYWGGDGPGRHRRAIRDGRRR